MLRRVGYILGVLFVLACAAAYPLTMRREAIVLCGTGDLQVYARVGGGRVKFAFRLQPFDLGGFQAWTQVYEEERRLFAPLIAQTFFRGVRVSVPLWLLALGVSVFMGWRWRRGQAAGHRPAADEAASSPS